jgi:hypothetical protein
LGQQFLYPVGGANIAGGATWGFPAATSTQGSGTGRTIQAAGTGIWTGAAGVGLGVYGAATGIGIYNAGSGGAHNNMPPFMALYYCIRYN